MSEFSELCKKYIKRGGTNIYQLAKRSGLERTSIQRMVNGSRLPGKEFVQSVCANLKLNRAEEEELLELYEIEKIGRSVFLNRKAIWKIIYSVYVESQSSVNQMSLLHLDMEKRPQLCMELKDKKQQMVFMDYMIRREIEGHAWPSFYLNDFPLSSNCLSMLLEAESKTEKEIKIRQFINLYKQDDDEKNASVNLRIIQQVIVFAFSFQGVFEVYYTYRDRMQEHGAELWPGYVVTSECILQISGDGTRSLGICSPELARRYCAEQENLKNRFRRLVYVKQADGEFFREYIRYSLQDEAPAYVMESYPCMWNMLDEEILDKNRESIHAEGMEEVVLQIIRKDSRTKYYFGLNEVDRLLDHGTLPGIYKKYGEIPDPESRVKMLRNLQMRIRRSEEDFHLLREPFGNIQGMNVELYRHNRVCFIKTTEAGEVNLLYIQENGIYDMFQDFFESLNDREYVYSPSETEQILEQKINRY